MFEKVNAIAAWMNKIVDRAEYYFKVVKWFFDALRKVSEILSSFPRYNPPADANAQSQNSGSERSGSDALSNGESVQK